jgi:class 3 adenylate cyclase
MNDLPASPSDGGTHGFLFADLRGYTHLVDTRGAVEASHLLGRYRAIVREVLTHHGGAEIKTEGDSFYVVLPSASTALRCGLDILLACREPSDGGEPIKLGIGIHAGESVAHQGGFVGSAVNIAARICALAAAGELLVSGTIRELTRSIVAAEFVFVGRRALKGLAEPVEVFRVVPKGASTSVQGRSREGVRAGRPARWLMVATVVVAVLAMSAIIALAWRPISGLLGNGGVGGSTASSGPSASQLAGSPSFRIEQLPEVGQPVSPGMYAPNRNRDVASVTVSGSDWKVVADVEDLLFFERPSPPGTAGVGLAQITVVDTGGCGADPTRIIGNRPQDLISWVQSAPQFDASEPRSVLDLGRSGIGIEATVLAPPGNCGDSYSRLPTEVFLWGVGGDSWHPVAGTRIVFEALDDGSRTLTVVFAAGNATELTSAEEVSRDLLESMVLRE